MFGAVIGSLATALLGGVAAAEVWRKNIHCWLPGYLRWRKEIEPFDPGKPLHIYFCFVDHYEPLWNGASLNKGTDRVLRWLDEYPALADPFRDAEGRAPQHRFFYPAEEY